MPTPNRPKQVSMVRRTLSVSALALGMVVGAVASASPAAASTTVSGTVMCVSQADVVGIWIQAENGGSGWARRSSVSGLRWHSRYSYSLPRGGRYQVHV